MRGRDDGRKGPVRGLLRSLLLQHPTHSYQSQSLKKTELLDQVVQKSGVTKAVADKVLAAVTDSIAESMADGKKGECGGSLRRTFAIHVSECRKKRLYAKMRSSYSFLSRRCTFAILTLRATTFSPCIPPSGSVTGGLRFFRDVRAVGSHGSQPADWRAHPGARDYCSHFCAVQGTQGQGRYFASRQ